MKVFLKSFFSPLWNSKITVALALSLILVGAAAFFWGGSAERALGERCTYYQCGDCVDNDGDTFIDFDSPRAPRDPDCESATDDSEGLVGVPVCGNGIIEIGEECDGNNNLGGQSCTSRGFTGGTLLCSADCDFNTSQCTNGGPGAGNEEESIPLCGFAWGATDETLTPPKMGVGWVSFNSKDCDTNGNNLFDDGVPGCPTSGRVFPYAVSVDEDRYLKGYAWSSVGWIQFDDLDDFPNGLHGNPGQDARIASNNNTSDLLGWVRAVAAIGRNDGWDGWISLKGSLAGLPGLPGSSGSAYGITFNKNTKKFSGYSWGGEVVGWLKWDSSPGRSVKYCSAEELGVTLVAEPASGQAPLPSVLTATITLGGGGTIGYRFKCDNSDTWVSNGDSNVFNGCRTNNFYSIPGKYYYPRVEATKGSLIAEATTEVRTLPDPGSLGAECSVTPDPLLINKQAEWKAEVSQPSGTMLPYTYTFTFNDDPTNPVISVSSSTSMTINRTYSTLGKKSVGVFIRDSATGENTATGNCEEDIGVIVRPKIIEI